MNCNPTLTAEEFRVLHNTLWELGKINDATVQTLVERIRTVALKGAYEQDNSAFETKHDYYSRFRKDNGLSSIWSLFETPAPSGFLAKHPFPSDAFVVYGGQHCAVNGPTWGDVYRAADACIRNSGTHHMFIESFTLENGNELHMGTGS